MDDSQYDRVLDDKLKSIEIMDREGDITHNEATDCCVCDRVGKTQRCSKCKRVWYCSKECQKAHWPIHRKSCKRPAKDTEIVKLSSVPHNVHSGRFADGSRYGNCNYCNYRGVLKSCASCKNSHYCSKKCQKLDWFSHKLICRVTDMSNKANQNYETQTDTYGKPASDPKDITFRRNTKASAGACCLGLEQQHDVPENTPSSAAQISRETWQRAKNEIMRRFRHHWIHDTFANMPFETESRTSRSVALLYMSRTHVYFPRHCIYIQDIKKEELYIAFYIDDDNPAPYFTWDDVKPGRFICIKNAKIQQFLCGTIGIRIEDPQSVSFLDVSHE